MGWVAVDLDGTLAKFHGFVDPYTIGEPVPEMISKVIQLFHHGIEVRVFTARIDPEGLRRYRESTGDSHATPEAVTFAIEEWCRVHLGRVLKVTDRKDLETSAIWDDMAVKVVRNTGRLVE